MFPFISIQLIGTEEQVLAAKINIFKDLSGTLTYEVEGRLLRWIGSNEKEALEEICKTHDVRIEFGSQVAHFKGRKSGCDGALTAFQSIIAQRSSIFETAAKNSLKPVAARVASITSPPVNTEDQVIVPQEGTMTQHRKYKTVTLTQPIEPDFVRLIIGRRGENINRLSREHNVSIQFDEKKTVIIMGMKDRCEAALRAINAIVDKRKEMDRAAAASRAVRNSRSWNYC